MAYALDVFFLPSYFDKLESRYPTKFAEFFDALVHPWQEEAARLGYPQQADFAQAFQQATGLSPPAWHGARSRGGLRAHAARRGARKVGGQLCIARPLTCEMSNCTRPLLAFFQL